MLTQKVFLKVVQGEDKSKGWELVPEDSYTLGRSRRCDLHLTDNTVSATHATFECHKGIWFVEDVGSSHGTYVNRQRVSGRKLLLDRDVIHVGKSDLEFREYAEFDEATLAEVDAGLTLPE